MVWKWEGVKTLEFGAFDHHVAHHLFDLRAMDVLPGPRRNFITYKT